MSYPVPISFISFDFEQSFHTKKEHYDHNLVQAWFEAGIMECQGSQKESSRGMLMELRQSPPLPEGHRPSREPLVLVQVLQLMPLKLNGDEDSGAVLHELAVVVWGCSPEGSLLNPFDDRYRITRRPETRLLLVFNRWMSWSLMHCHNKRHLGLVFSRELYSTILSFSSELAASMSDRLALGWEITLGRTEMEAVFNCQQHFQAHTMILKVFQLIDHAWIRIEGESSNLQIQNLGLYITGSLDFVRSMGSSSSCREQPQ